MSKIYFQGTYGAYSHIASLNIDPKANIVPCKTFDECFEKGASDANARIVVPESNRITGNIGIEYLIFKYRLNIYEEYFQKIEHSLLALMNLSYQILRMFIHTLRLCLNAQTSSNKII